MSINFKGRLIKNCDLSRFFLLFSILCLAGFMPIAIQPTVFPRKIIDASSSNQISLNQLSVQNKNQVSDEVRFVAAGIKNFRDQFFCGQLEIVVHESTPQDWIDTVTTADPEQKTKLIASKTTKATWYYQNSKLSVVVESDPRAKEVWRRQSIKSDSNTEQGLQEIINPEIPNDPNSFYTGSITPFGTSIENELWKDWRGMDPRYYSYFYGRFPLDKLFLRDTGVEYFDRMPLPLFKGEFKIDGNRCMLIQVKPNIDAEWNFWIDTERGFLLKKMQGLTLVNGKMVVEFQLQASGIIRVSNSWLPTKLKREDYLYPLLDKKTGLNKENTKKLEPYIFEKSIDISPIKNEKTIKDLFVMNWPVGTNITDDIMQKRLIVVAVEKTDLDIFNKQRKSQSKSGYVSTSIKKSDLMILNQRRRDRKQVEMKDAVAVAIDEESLKNLEKLQSQQEAPKAITQTQ